MKVILTEDVEKLGKVGSVVDVKDGFGRNYLLPRKLAIQASSGNLKLIEDIKKQKTTRESKKLYSSQKLKEELEKISITVQVPVGEEDRVFGSVTTADIAELIKEKGFSIDKRNILLEEPIKALGIYEVPIKLHTEVTAELKLWVVKKEEK